MHKLLHTCILLSVGCILIRFSSSRNAAILQSTSDQNRLLRATHGTIKHHRQQQRKRRRQRGLVVSRAKDIISFNEQSNQAIERSSSNTPREDPTRPSSSLPEFTYRYAKKACVKEQDIINISTFIKEMYTKHNIRVFPRNGFLLGIIRHGGFLPTEGVDADLGVVYEDLLHLYNTFKKTNTGKKQGYLDDDFFLQLEPTNNLKYMNWHGLEPVTQTPYKYFGVMFRCTSKRYGGDKFRMHATSVYQYRGDTSTYFYPRCDLAETNHDVHVVDSLRWNEEGGDYRLIDTDERINESNFNKDDDSQLASILKTSFDCFMDVQFYFTTIQVPCEYDEILTSMFGTNWRYIERRGPNGGNRHASKAVSEEENDKIMSFGPRPICEA